MVMGISKIPVADQARPSTCSASLSTDCATARGLADRAAIPHRIGLRIEFAFTPVNGAPRALGTGRGT